MTEEEAANERGDNRKSDHHDVDGPIRVDGGRCSHLVEQRSIEDPAPATADPAHHLDDERPAQDPVDDSRDGPGNGPEGENAEAEHA
jgi:hypothetical protein